MLPRRPVTEGALEILRQVEKTEGWGPAGQLSCVGRRQTGSMVASHHGVTSPHLGATWVFGRELIGQVPSEGSPFRLLYPVS